MPPALGLVSRAFGTLAPHAHGFSLGWLTAEEAFQGLDFLLQTVPRLVSSSSLAGQALRLAPSYRVPVYDCLYLALALQERCGLVTADAALVRATGPHLGMVVELADFAGWTR